MLALLGDLTLSAVQIAPWFVVIFFGVVIANRVFLYWVGAAALIFFVWVNRPSFRVEGRELRPAQAPRLFAELEALRQKLRVPRRMQVLLDDELNAGATETRGLFGIIGTRRVLTLGVPLLAALNRDELLAVVAHEFGHFSRRHGRLGQWLYRAREGWLRYAAQIRQSDSSFDRAAAWYARRFVPYFSARSFVHSRRCEYEADRDAALAVGSDVFAAALTRTAVSARLWHEAFHRHVVEWQRQSPTPPRDFYDRFARLSAASVDTPAWLAEALHERAGWSDTHPNLTARLAALKETARLTPRGGSAGESLLGESWAQILASANAAWLRRAQVDWALEHYRLKHITAKLLDEDEATARAWPVERQLARARALRAVEPQRGLEELRRLHERAPEDGRVGFAYAAALLSEKDEGGADLLKRIAKNQPLFRLAVYQRLLAYYEECGEVREIERYNALFEQAMSREAEAMKTFAPVLEEGKASASSLPANAKRALADALAVDASVQLAWLFEGRPPIKTGAQDDSALPLTVHALVLTVDPEVLRTRQEDEDVVLQRYHRAMALFVYPNEVVLVRTLFTTETVPSAINTRSDALLHQKPVA